MQSALKYDVMIRMLFKLLRGKKFTAKELAEEFSVSTRTIYRYIYEMSYAHIPIDVTRGPNGGIYISDTFKISFRGFLTREEYERTIQAMQAMESERADPVLHSALEKLAADYKPLRSDGAVAGNILIDSGAWGGDGTFSEKLSLLERAAEEREKLEIDYVSRSGARTHRVIRPHLLVYKQNIWYVYAFCEARGAFRLFKIGRMRTILRTGEFFERMPFSREDIPLSFWTESEACVEARFALSEEAVPFAEEWLGVEAVREENGRMYAEAVLPDDASLVGKILSAGAGFRVLSPASLAERVRSEALRIAQAHSD